MLWCHHYMIPQLMVFSDWFCLPFTYLGSLITRDKRITYFRLNVAAFMVKLNNWESFNWDELVHVCVWDIFWMFSLYCYYLILSYKWMHHKLSISTKCNHPPNYKLNTHSLKQTKQEGQIMKWGYEQIRLVGSILPDKYYFHDKGGLIILGPIGL